MGLLLCCDWLIWVWVGFCGFVFWVVDEFVWCEFGTGVGVCCG